MALFTPTLAEIGVARLPIHKEFLGSYFLPGNDGGYAQRTVSVSMDFDKTRPFAWMGWVRFRDDDTRVHTILSLGTIGTNGYRIVKTKSGSTHRIGFQETSSLFTTELFALPNRAPGIRQFNHWAFNIVPTSATAVTIQFFWNGRPVSRIAGITWANAVNIASGVLRFGAEYSVENFLGWQSDVVYYNRAITINDVLGHMLHRRHGDAVSRWLMDERIGSNLNDVIGPNVMTINGQSQFSIVNQTKNRGQRWQMMQFNYGQFAQHGAGYYNVHLSYSDFVFLWDKGVRELRIGLGNYLFPSGYATGKSVAIAAKAFGFRVIVVLAAENYTDANWANFQNEYVNNFCPWAQTNGMDEVQANEIEYSQTVDGLLTNAVQKIKDMTTAAKPNFSGVHSYAVAQDSLEATWISTGKGPLDKISYNPYGSNGDFNDWKNKINTWVAAFGYEDTYLSEWGLHNLMSGYPPTLAAQNAAFLERLEWLTETHPKLRHFFFTMRWSVLTNSQFALVESTQNRVRDWQNVVFRNPVVQRQVAIGRTIVTNRPLL